MKVNIPTIRIAQAALSGWDRVDIASSVLHESLNQLQRDLDRRVSKAYAPLKSMLDFDSYLQAEMALARRISRNRKNSNQKFQDELIRRMGVVGDDINKEKSLMSRTTLFAAFKDNRLVEIGEFRNSYRSAYWIWMELCKKHNNCEFSLFGTTVDPSNGKTIESASVRATWALANNPAVPVAERLALQTTFDHGLCPRDLMLEVADALENFSPPTENLQGQAVVIRQAHAKGAKAIAWHQTSVAENEWHVVSRSRERAFNIKKDFNPELHWWIKKEVDVEGHQDSERKSDEGATEEGSPEEGGEAVPKREQER